MASSLGALRAYLAERFPVPITALLSLALGAVAYTAAQAPLIRAGAPLVIDAVAVGGCAMVFLFLFHLRVFDEHKDFEVDSKTRPDRPVQRGLISLRTLKILGAIAIAGELALALQVGATVEAALFLAPLAYSVLMFFEFFARAWLARRLAWYAVTHTVVMSLLIVALAVRATGQLPLEVWLAAALCFASSFAIDVLRKMFAPDHEVRGVDSYTKKLGVVGATTLAVVTLDVAAALAAWLGWTLGGGFVWTAVVAGVTLWGAAMILRFRLRPTPSTEKMLQVVAGVHLLVLFFGLAVVAGLEHGVRWFP